MEGSKWRGERRSATLHSEVFHFNGPPGDWLTLLEDPSPFRHNGPLHYLFVLANVLPEATALVSTSFHFRARLIAARVYVLFPSTTPCVVLRRGQWLTEGYTFYRTRN